MLLFLISGENDSSFEVTIHFVDLLQDLIESLSVLSRASVVQIVCGLCPSQSILYLSLEVLSVYTNFLSLCRLDVYTFGGYDFFCLIIAVRSAGSWKV